MISINNKISKHNCTECIHNSICKVQELINIRTHKSELCEESFDCIAFIPVDMNEEWIKTEVNKILNHSNFNIAALLDKQMIYKYRLDEAKALLESIVQLYTDDNLTDKETLLQNNLLPRIFKYLDTAEDDNI